jgi:hypothetical protein
MPDRGRVWLLAGAGAALLACAPPRTDPPAPATRPRDRGVRETAEILQRAVDGYRRETGDRSPMRILSCRRDGAAHEVEMGPTDRFGGGGRIRVDAAGRATAVELWQ